jgi:hypothetical protein
VISFSQFSQELSMKAQFSADPFALMMNPQAILQAMEHSERLQHLERHICRPLDKPLIPHTLSALEVYDHEIDDDADETGDDFDDGLGE